MKVMVRKKNGDVEEHGSEGYMVAAEPNEHGDLIIYRVADTSMMGGRPTPIASYAADEWCSHKTIWDDA